MTDQSKNGIIKIVAGLFMVVFGALGVVQSKKIVKRGRRLAATILSLLMASVGFYLLVSGVDDIALAKIGTTELGKQHAVALGYQNKNDFEVNLHSTFERDENKGIRRLDFKCTDDSRSFTVYNSAVGILGVPDESIKCKDGTSLLFYSDEVI